MRGRSRTKSPNPLTRSFESNGPDVKIRGTAQHVADKYAQLARDAQASGDPVAAENYLQHAEHYYRLIATAQEQFRQQYGGNPRSFDDDGEEGDEESAPFGSGQGQGGDEYGEPAGYPPSGYEQPRQGNDRGAQTRFDRNGGRPQQQRFDRAGERFDRANGGGERQGSDRQGYDRQGGDRQGYERPAGDRQGSDRQGGDRPGYERPAGERYDRGNGGYDRRDKFAKDGRDARPDRDPRSERDGLRTDRDNRQDRDPRPDRDSRQDRDTRSERQPEGARSEPRSGGGDEDREKPAASLPAFLTTPMPRQAISVEGEGEVVGSRTSAAGDHDADAGGINGTRTRRRRTRKPEASAEGGGPEDVAGSMDNPAE